MPNKEELQNVSDSFKKMAGMGPVINKEEETKKEEKPEKSMMQAMMRKLEGMGM